MLTWRKVVAAVLLLQAVVATPLVNKLAPGAKYPERNSFQQPSNNEETAAAGEISKPETVTAEIPDTPAKEVAEPTAATTPDQLIDDESDLETPPEDDIEEPKNETFIVKAIDLTKDDVKVDYSGAQVWEISLQPQGVRSIVNRLTRRNLISPWGGNQSFVDVLVKPTAINNVTKVMKREKIPYEVIIDDLQLRINDENPPLDEAEEALQNRRGHRMTWKRYHGIEDIYGFMDYLAKQYPSFVSVETIGKSYLGRDIKALRISDGKATNKRVFVDGGIHAREWISPATVTFFINQFAENFDDESQDIKNIDWHFVPVINPDGYEHTRLGDRLWRKNMKPVGAARRCLGTDLNRNWGYQWGGKGSSNNPCSDIYRGNRAFSEPETKAVAEYIKTHGPYTSYLSYHSYGQYILYPWGYDNTLPTDHQDLQAVGTKMAQVIEQTGGSKYSVGSSSGLLYPAAGGSDDWAKAQGIKYAYTVELSDTGRYGFILPASFIEPVARESLAGLRVLAAAVNKG